MFKNILIPLDGSPAAESALPFAQALARQSGACLTLVRATHTVPSMGDRATAQLQVTHAAEDYVRRLADDLTGQGFTVQTGIPFGGSTSDWIVEEASMHSADLVVMATHDRSGPDRWVHGSVAEAVVGKLSIPVLLIRAAVDHLLDQRLDDEHPTLVVPLDGSELAEAAAPLALAVASSLGGHLVLIAVVASDAQVSEAQAHLDLTAAGLVGQGVTSECTVRVGEAAEQIASAADELHAAVIVMATHGRSGVVRTLMGSVAGEVLHRASTPVLLIHP